MTSVHDSEGVWFSTGIVNSMCSNCYMVGNKSNINRWMELKSRVKERQDMWPVLTKPAQSWRMVFFIFCHNFRSKSKNINPISTCGLVTRNILYFIEPITESGRKTAFCTTLWCNFFLKFYHKWLDKNKSITLLDQIPCKNSIICLISSIRHWPNVTAGKLRTFASNHKMHVLSAVAAIPYTACAFYGKMA